MVQGIGNSAKNDYKWNGRDLDIAGELGIPLKGATMFFLCDSKPQFFLLNLLSTICIYWKGGLVFQWMFCRNDMKSYGKGRSEYWIKLFYWISVTSLTWSMVMSHFNSESVGMSVENLDTLTKRKQLPYTLYIQHFNWYEKADHVLFTCETWKVVQTVLKALIE